MAWNKWVSIIVNEQNDCIKIPASGQAGQLTPPQSTPVSSLSCKVLLQCAVFTKELRRKSDLDRSYLNAYLFNCIRGIWKFLVESTFACHTYGWGKLPTGLPFFPPSSTYRWTLISCDKLTTRIVLVDFRGIISVHCNLELSTLSTCIQITIDLQFKCNI